MIVDRLKKIKKDQNLLTLASGSAQAFTARIIGLMVGFTLNLFAARWLGADQYGIYTYTVSIMMVIAVISQLGFHSSVVRFTAAYITNKEWSKLRGLIGKSRAILFLSSISAAIIGTILIIWIIEIGRQDLKIALLIGFWVIPLEVLLLLNQNYLRAMRYTFLSVFPEQVLKPAITLLLIVVLYYTGSLNSANALSSYLLSTGCTLLFCWAFFYKLSPVELRVVKKEYETHKWLKVSLPMMFASMAQILLNRTDVLMLGSMRSMTEVGIYNTAVRISDLNLFTLSAINQIFAPMISSLYAAGDKIELQRMISIASFLIFITTLPIAISIFFSSKWILGIFGKEFEIGSWALRFLVCGKLINAISGSVGFLLIMTGLQNKFLKVILVSFALKIALNLYAIPVYGIEGAAVATSLIMCFWNIWMIIIVYQKLGLRSYVTFKLTGLNIFILRS